MKLCCPPFFALALLSILIGAPPAHAASICTSADSDPDGDGWGWENDTSCLVTAADLKPLPPICEMASSEPDGDGWGWENDTSCITDTSSSPTPGNSISTATPVAVDSELVNRLSSESETHWYSFDISESEYAFDLAVNNGAELFTEFSLQLEDGSGVVKAYLDYFGLEQSSGAFCVDPGRYFLSVNSFFFPDENPGSYNVSLRSTNLRCAYPEYSITDFVGGFATITGGYVYVSDSNQLIAVSHDGQTLWTLDDILDGYVIGLVASADNTLYAYNDTHITAVSSAGSVVWTVAARGGHVNHVAADDRGVYLVSGFGDVIGLDPDGREQWLVPADDNRRAKSIQIGDDGTLYLRSYDSVSILRP